MNAMGAPGPMNGRDDDPELAAERLLARDARTIWHPYTPHGADPAPLPVVRARGAELELAGGRRLIDAISSWWTCLHGHGEPALVAALGEQAATLDHVLFAGATHEPAVALAEALLETFRTSLATPARGPRLERVFFSDDGSTAVEVALKIVRHSWVERGEPARRLFVALEGGYHGDTFGAMSVGDPDPFFAAYRPLLFEVKRVAPRDVALREVLARLGREVAGVIVEPLVQGAAGMRMHDASFVRAARAACDEAGVPLIADEVMTGFGRTGGLFACATAGVAPDLLCLAKGLTNGMVPLAATLATNGLFETFASFARPDRGRFLPHGHSMTGNPIGCAVALRSLALARERGVPERLAAIGARIEAGLAPLTGDRRVRDLRRTGGIVAFDLVPRAGSPGSASGYVTPLAPRLRARAVELGVLLRPLGNVVYALPPAATSDAQCDAIAAAMRALVEVVS
jgi:adenosylmethionine---8-amino-7-oxononanoate aminotransferase